MFTNHLGRHSSVKVRIIHVGDTHLSDACLQVNVLAIAALALPPGIKSQWRQLRQAGPKAVIVTLGGGGGGGEEHRGSVWGLKGREKETTWEAGREVFF